MAGMGVEILSFDVTLQASWTMVRSVEQESLATKPECPSQPRRAGSQRIDCRLNDSKVEGYGEGVWVG